MIGNRQCSRTSAEGMLLVSARSRSMFSRSPVATACHGKLDGRYGAHSYTRAEMDAEVLRALGQWLDYLWKREYLILVAA